MIIAGRVANTEEGGKRLAEFAETLQAPVIDQGGNLPSRHPLIAAGGGALIRNADVILALEVDDLWASLNNFRDQLHRTYKSTTKKDVKVISIRTGDLFMKSNYQDFQRYAEVDLAMAADPEATLPSLTEATKRLITDDRKRAFQDRGRKMADNRQKALEKRASTRRTAGTPARSACPVSRPNCGRRSRMRIGHIAEREESARSGISTSITGACTAEARQASDLRRHPRWAPHWRIASTAGCACTSRTTAT